MKKKKIDLTSFYALLILVVTLFIIGGIGLFMKYHSFNPETDIPIRVECLGDRFNWNGSVCIDSWIDDNHYVPSIAKVKKWRQKTKCEINPEAEGCVCDEWEEIEKNVIIENGVNYWCVGRDLIARPPITKNRTIALNWIANRTCWAIEEGVYQIINGTYLVKGKCISSHEPNECELNNPDYVWDCVIWEGNVLDIPKYNRTTCLEKTCRRRTIYDYSCDELKIAIILDKDINICHHKPGLFGGCITWKRYDKEDLYEIFKEKGCKI